MDKELFDKAMSLSPNERLTFAELMISSVNKENEEIRRSWIKEVKDRIEAVNKGTAKLIDFDDLYNAS